MTVVKFSKAATVESALDYAMRKGGDMVAVCVVWIDRDGMVCTRWSCDIPEMAAMTAAMNKYLHEEL